MTLLQTPAGSRALREPGEALVDESGPGPLPAPAGKEPAVRPSRRRLAGTVGLVVVTVLATVAVVAYGIGPLLAARDQRALVADEQAAIAQSALERDGLGGIKLPTQPPVPGSTVGLLAIPSLGLNLAVVEGVQPAQTISGPGHVPGTAGLGQPGNAAVVGRNAAFGAPFARLDQLQKGDRIVTATVEGQTTYVVRRVRVVKLGPSFPTTKLYGPTVDNQLTLVTSDSIVPWNSTRALTVVARMVGKPFVPTPQESASPSEAGTGGDANGWPLFVLSLLVLGLVVAGSVYLYRRTSTRVAYLLTTAPIIAFSVLSALAFSRLLPAWM